MTDIAEPPEQLLSARLERIEAKIDRLIGGPPSEIVRVREAMQMTGTRSYGAFYRVTSALHIRPYLKGKYRRSDIENALAKKLFRDKIANNSP